MVDCWEKLRRWKTLDQLGTLYREVKVDREAAVEVWRCREAVRRVGTVEQR